MENLFFILLGFIQGLTEFLPVSSSGHLALAQNFFNWAQKESLTIEIMAHLGSLVAILVYYKKEVQNLIQNTSSKELLNITPLLSLFLSMLPAGLVGLFMKDQITLLFSDIKVIAASFLFTSLTLLTLYYISKKHPEHLHKDWPSPLEGLFIGAAQALALLPGVSRSGTTISAGVITGLKPERAALFSFCSVAPLILAATGLSFLKLITHAEQLTASETPLNLGLLLISSFLFGLLGLSLVIKFLEKERFHYFAAYLIPLACAILIWG